MRRGFTLVELLVVMAIIAILAALLIPMTMRLLFMAKASVTKQRMNQVVTALQAYAQAEGSACLALQRAASLGGPEAFASIESVRQIARGGGAGRSLPPDILRAGGLYRILDDGSWSPDDMRVALARQRVSEVVPPETGPVASTWYLERWPAQWPETNWMATPNPGTAPPVLRYPWGKPGLRRNLTLTEPGRPATDIVGQFGSLTVPNTWLACGNSPPGARIWNYTVASPLKTSPVAASYTAFRSDGTQLSGVSGAEPIPFDAGWMSPLATIRLLQAAGVLAAGAEGENAYRTDRSPKRDWNDRWGRPLLVTYALYAPERCFSNDTARNAPNNERDQILAAALEVYGYNRALYVSVAAPGPKLDAALTPWAAGDDAVRLRDLWNEVRAVVDAHEWTEDSFMQGTWKGVRQKSESGKTGFLSAPVEIK